MIDEDRLHREIDHENTPEESERLREELEREPEARAQYERLVHLARTLESVPAEEPPLGLLSQVMRVVRANALASSTVSRFWGSFRQRFLLRPALGLSLTFASGLLVGAILAGVGDLGPLRLGGDDGSAAGTMVAPKGLGLHEIDRAQLAGEDFHGEASLSASGNQVEVRVHVEGRPPLQLSVTSDRQEVEPVGLEGEGGEMRLGPGSLQVVDAGPGDYVLRLAVRKTSLSQVEVALGRGTDRVAKVLRVAEVH